MRTKLLVVAIALVLGACGDDGGAGGGGDDVGDDAQGAVTFPLTFEVAGDVPLLVAIKNDAQPWQKLANAIDGMYTVDVTRRHAIAVVCGSSDAIFQTAIELRVTSDDPPFLFCYNFTDPSPTTYAVTGQMQQAGQVTLDDSASSTTAPWSFDLTVAAGTHDLFAFGASKMEIQRNKQINATTALPTVNLAANGTDYAVTSVTVQNLELGETTRAGVFISTENDFASYEIDGTTVNAAPASLLNAGDFQSASIRASTPTTDRNSYVDVGGIQTLTLLPRLTAVTFGPTGPSWVVLPQETDSVSYNTAVGAAFLSIDASTSYLGMETSFDIDLDIPDYDPAWQVPFTGGRLTVFDENVNTTAISSNASVTSARARLSAVQRLQLDRAVRRAGGVAGVARARR